MTAPRVSVCVVTFNHARYIHDCLMSVIAQARDVDLEIVVGDDQSTDQTGMIVRDLADRYPDIVRYHRHSTRLGPGGNYQDLISRARGQYLAHLDGDDHWLPGKLQKQVALLDAQPSLAACYTNALCVEERGTPRGVFNNPQPPEFGLEYLLEGGNFLNHSSLLYRAEWGREICAWAPSFLDYKIHLMLASKGALGYLNCLGVVYRVNSSTSMSLLEGDRVRQMYWEAIRGTSAEPSHPDSQLSASADLVRRMIFRGARLGSLDLAKTWWSTVATFHQGQRAELALKVLECTVSAGCREAFSRIAARVDGTGLRVMYWR